MRGLTIGRVVRNHLLVGVYSVIVIQVGLMLFMISVGCFTFAYVVEVKGLVLIVSI